MTRSRVCFPGYSYSIRPRLYFLLTIFLASAYIVLRSRDNEVITGDGFKDERLAHLGLDRVTYTETKSSGVDFSPLKGLGVDRWVPGGKRKVLITGVAGQIGLALVPRLQEEYEVYVLDVQPRPSALLLPTSARYYRSSATSVEELLSQHAFSGIVNLAGVSILEWCEADPQKCEEANVGTVRDIFTALEGGRQKRWWKGSASVPWIVLGSGIEVYPENGQAMSVLGRTKAAAERILRDHVEHGGDAVGANVRAAIVRFSTIYGFHTRTVVSETFIHRALVNGAISGHTQYDSDSPPLDLIHVDDALDGIVAAIRKMDRRGAQASLMTLNLVSGSRTPQEQVVHLISELAGSRGTTKDIGSGQAAGQTWRTYDNSEAEKAIGWRPKHSLVSGLTAAIANIHKLNKEWTYAYLAHNCPSSTVLETPLDATTLLSNKNNRDLARLDGCTVNIGFNRGGFLDYVKCPSKTEDGVKCTVDREKVVSYNWGASVFIIRREKGGSRRERTVRVRLEEEKGRGLLGLPSLGGSEPLAFELLPTKADGQAVFDLEVSEDDSSLRFLLPNNATQLLASPHASINASILSLEPAGAFDVRMNVLCCPIEGDWPLLEDDYESADVRFGSTGDIPFNSSRRTATCSRAEEAWHHSQAMLEAPPAAVKGKNTHKPIEWAMKDLPPCWNDCAAPTVCVQTGSCRCVQAECPTRRGNPLSLASTSAMTPKPFAEGKSALGKLRPFANVLGDDVRAGNWEDLLLPSFRAQYGKSASLPAVHVVDGYPGQEEIESAACHKLQTKHCFSADSIMYRAMRHLSVPAEEAELIILPVYQHCDGAKFLLHDVMAYAGETIPGVRTGEKKVAITLTHDWGICIAFAWEMWSARENHRLYPDWILNNVLVWSVMGDYDSPCYRPHQDVVIPARTCQSPALKETFGDISNVMPARQRPKLVTWAGTYWGTGKSERLRMTCDRGGAGERELVKGGGARSDWISWDYMKNLGQARFCPQPRGIAGWSPRVNDAIYAGCIPVLTAEGTHYPYSTTLDWTKFSVRLLPTDLDRIEEILAAIPIEKVEELQRNLMLVRDAFIYSSDEAPEDELERRGPMFWALQEAKTRLGMEYA